MLSFYVNTTVVSWMLRREQSRDFQDDYTWRKFKLKPILDDINNSGGMEDDVYINVNFLTGELVIGEDFVCKYPDDMHGGMLCDEPGIVYLYNSKEISVQRMLFFLMFN